MNNKVQLILSEAKKAVTGKDDVIEKVLMAVLSNGHVLIEDVPGVGKTTLAITFSKVLGLDYKRVQFTPDSVPSDITGFSFFDRESNSFRYQPGAAATNFLLADEINRTSSKTQSALLEVMEERRITVDGVTRYAPNPFIVIATQNPTGSAGTQNLPVSQLDRFMIKLEMGYPDFKSEVDILRNRRMGNPVDGLNAVTDKNGILAMQQECESVYVAEQIYEYITYLAKATRDNSMTSLGISTRGSLAVCRMAKAYAYMNGRDYVLPEDVAAVFLDVCAHRIIVTQKAKITGMSGVRILEEVLKEVTMPVIGK